MPYVKKIKIKDNYYWYLFHTIRDGAKFLKKSKYLGKELPENTEDLKESFLEEIKGSGKYSKLIESLTVNERKILPLLKNSLKEVIEVSKLKEVEVMRALQWLENKKLINLTNKEETLIELDSNGKKYLEKGLPEKRFLEVLDKPKSMEKIMEEAGLDKDEVTVSLGFLKNNKLIVMGKEIKKVKDYDFSEVEDFLKKLPANKNEVNESLLKEFKLRKNIVKEETKKIWRVELENLGKELVKENLNIKLEETLTSEMLRNLKFKTKRFRRYDVEVKVPKIYPGKRHFVNQAIDYARRIWLDLGFEEMEGKIINTSFWNFDSLFTPQDHPARDLQDSIFLKQHGKLPSADLVKKVKEMHEKGGSGSKGWGYDWNKELAKKLVMRTHTTVLSAKTLAKLKKEDYPKKYFAIGKNFRNETVDWSHGFEFYQTEGIVIDPDMNFKHLLGYLKEFFKKMGFEKVRFRPAFFGYTSPSVEVDILHPIKKTWIELGGAGIFRPEVTIPLLGKETPVLAWGLGLGRIVMDYYDISDLRDFYKNDIKQLREVKSWLM